MFGWAVTSLTVAIVAGIFGFAGLAGTATWIAKALFGFGLVAFLVLLVVGRSPPAVQKHASSRRAGGLPCFIVFRACRRKMTKIPQQKQLLDKSRLDLSPVGDESFARASGMRGPHPL